jgi:transposase-like protein
VPLSNPKEPAMTFSQFESKFPTEEAAIDYFYNIRYGGVLTCPHCGATDKVYRCHNRPKACRCKNCDNMFSPFKGMIFEKTMTDLRKWFQAIRLFLNARKGFSAKNLQRELGIAYETAWRMFHQVRVAMQNGGV